MKYKIIYILLILFTNNLFANNIHIYEDKVNEINQYLESFIQKKKENNLFIALTLSQNPDIKKALTQNNPNLINLKKISKEIRNKTQFKNVWFQLITKDGISAKRSWNSKQGDDLKLVRLDVQNMINNPKITESISTGKFAMTFKSMIPIYDKNNKFIGIFETISHFNSISKELRKEGIESIILVDKGYKKQLKKTINKIFIDNYNVSNLDASSQLIDDLKKINIEQYLKKFTKRNYILNHKENTLCVYYLLKDSRNNPMGHFLLYYPIDNIVTPHKQIKNLNLTTIEKKYLKNNQVINFTGDPNWLPFEAFDKYKQYVGIVSEHLEYVENILDINFNKIISNTWDDALNIATKGEADIISGDAADDILNNNFNPIDTYIKSPIMIIMNNKKEYIENLYEIKDKTIAIIKDYGYTADIYKNYPNYKFVEVKNIQEGLLGVETKKYDAILASLVIASYHITSMGLENLAIVGKTDIMMNVTLFINKDKPILHSIINKAIHSMTQDQRQNILLKWKSTKLIAKTDYTLAWQFLVVVIILFLLFIRRNYVLKRHNQELSEEINKKRKIQKELYELNNNLERKVQDGIDVLEKQRLDHETNVIKNAKFTAIGQLAAGMTHEINTPLTFIKGNFEMMKYDIEDLPKTEIKNRMLEDSIKITDGIQRLSNIVESIREMAQKSNEKKENINIFHTLITSLTLLFNRSKYITNIKLNGEDFHINIDKNKQIFIGCIQKQRVEQVWVSIVNNALDELVKIDDYENRLIDINIKCDDNDFIIVKIKDNASGISETIINNIFDPFVSNKESNGMGIGLNVAKKIINEQDGDILAYNEGGAVFEVRLPSGKCTI